jgi:MoxR-like ATPase|tara:strand:+ start:3278 stop:4306 length:1029 start_codon:yes stop_codon:yes gene_type:complete
LIENNFINKWRSYADQIQIDANNLILGQEKAVTLIIISLFSRGHVLLEGGVGVGKTTLLQIITKLIGGEYERVEGTVDLMPNDIIYHASINDAGKPNISNGPLLKKGENLSIFFFNEINRARPQVHSLLLRAMAEKSISAFNKDIHLPNMVVFADRNQVEKNETFELPAAARDRFMMEISIQAPKDKGLRDSIIFDNKFQNTTKLVDEIPKPKFDCKELNEVSDTIQKNIQASDHIKNYVENLWLATENPKKFNIAIKDIDMDDFIVAGASPRGMIMLIKAAKVNAWLNNRDYIEPIDIDFIFHEVMAHRLVINRIYENNRIDLLKQFSKEVLLKVPTPELV